MFKVKDQPFQLLETRSDEELCQLAAQGSREAEEILVTRYNRLVDFIKSLKI